MRWHKAKGRHTKQGSKAPFTNNTSSTSLIGVRTQRSFGPQEAKA